MCVRITPVNTKTVLRTFFLYVFKNVETSLKVINKSLKFCLQNPDCTADKKTYCVPSMEKTINGVTYKNTMCQYCGVDTVACNKVCSRLFTQVILILN